MIVKNKWKRGDVHPETGLFYWNIKNGKEVWLEEENFYYFKNKTKEILRLWYIKNIKRASKNIRDYYYKRGGRERKKIKYMNDIEKYKQRLKESYIKYRERYKQLSRRWRINNPEKTKLYQQKKERINKERYINDPAFRLNKILGLSLRSILRKSGIRKRNSISNFLGCSFEFLKKYIESKFFPGMNWSNYGTYRINGPITWHIDHIVPVSSAKTVEDVERLYHYTNLQPLWCLDNIKKGNKSWEDYKKFLKVEK